jgi:hypothetical protein
MPHALVPRPTLGLLCLVVSLAALGCRANGEGDDLPPGAFTTGGSYEPPATDGSTAMASEGTSSTTSTPADTSSSSDGLPPVVSHAEHILPIWNASCIDAACHDADSPQVGLDMASEGVYERICTQTHAFSGFSYIDCVGHDPTRSYLFRKLENTHLDGDISGASGAGMPPMPLPAGDIALIEAWIVGGALP